MSSHILALAMEEPGVPASDSGKDNAPPESLTAATSAAAGFVLLATPTSLPPRAMGRGAVALDYLVGETELGDAPARRRRSRGGDDLTHRALRARRPCDRRADQADADQREAVKQWRWLCHKPLRARRVLPRPSD